MSLEIVTFQEDALANHFLITIGTFPGVKNLSDTNLRVLNVDLPDKSIPTYVVTYGGRKLTRPGGIIDTTNEFTVTYRVDKYLNVYKGFMAWMELIQNTLTGQGILGDAVPVTGGPSQFRIPITVQTFSPEAGGTPLGSSWLFTGCWPSTHGAITFDQETGDPLTASITFQFIDMIPPVE